MKKSILSLVILLCPTYAFCANPIVTGSSGTIATGQIVTISGSNLVDEDKTNWGTAYKSGTKYGFEGTSYTSDGYGIAPDNNSQDRSYDSTVKLMGSKSFKGRIYGNSSGCPTGNHSSGLYIDLSEDGVGSSTDFYVRLYSRWSSSGSGSLWPDNHIKLLDVQGTGDQLYFNPVAGESLPTQMNMLYDGANHNYTIANFLQQNRWYAIEARFKTSAPYNFTTWVDGVQVASATPSSVGNYAYVLFNIINACGFTNLDLTNWSDGFTVSTSRIYPASKIEISNNATYGSGTVKQQEPIYLSDGSVQIKADLTGLGSGPYYLFVTNNRQIRSSAYSLSSNNSDSSAPTTIISTSDQSSITGDSLAVSGASSDNTTVSGCKWRIGSLPDASNGTACTGTTSFSCSTSGYSSGVNTLYVGCYDATGNYGSDSIIVNFTPAVGGATPTESSVIGNLFNEPFDEGNFSIRGWYDNVNPALSSVESISGSSVEFRFPQGATVPISGTSLRKKFAASDSVYISYYVKYSANWQGSSRTYHPHEFMLLTNKDDDWAGLAFTNMTAYIEQNEGVPIVGFQDGQNVDQTRISQDLTKVTEFRGVAGCNGDSDGTGLGDCYSSGGSYVNGKIWKAGKVYFSDSAGAYYKNSWHKVEAYIKLNSIVNGKGVADGVIQYRFDGEEVINRSNVMLRTGKHSDMKFDKLVIAPWIGDGSPVDQTFWVDNLVLSTVIPAVQSNNPPAPSGLNIITK